MPRRPIDRVGNRYGAWTVLAKTPSETPRAVWLCRCECGYERTVHGSELGKQRSLAPCQGRHKIRAKMIGARFGMIEVVRPHRNPSKLVCRCDCGRTEAHHRSVLSGRPPTMCRVCTRKLRRNETRQARVQRTALARAEVIARRVARGIAPSPVRPAGLNSWSAMIQRCTNPNTQSWPDYGGRGIRVCERWMGKGGFENFLADMGERPEGMSLERRDPNDNYTPENCRWATALEQARSKRLSAGRVAEVLIEIEAESGGLDASVVIERVRIALLGSTVQA